MLLSFSFVGEYAIYPSFFLPYIMRRFPVVNDMQSSWLRGRKDNNKCSARGALSLRLHSQVDANAKCIIFLSRAKVLHYHHHSLERVYFNVCVCVRVVSQSLQNRPKYVYFTMCARHIPPVWCDLIDKNWFLMRLMCRLYLRAKRVTNRFLTP